MRTSALCVALATLSLLACPGGGSSTCAASGSSCAPGCCSGLTCVDGQCLFLSGGSSTGASRGLGNSGGATSSQVSHGTHAGTGGTSGGSSSAGTGTGTRGGSSGGTLNGDSPDLCARCDTGPCQFPNDLCVEQPCIENAGTCDPGHYFCAANCTNPSTGNFEPQICPAGTLCQELNGKTGPVAVCYPAGGNCLVSPPLGAPAGNLCSICGTTFGSSLMPSNSCQGCVCDPADPPCYNGYCGLYCWDGGCPAGQTCLQLAAWEDDSQIAVCFPTNGTCLDAGS